MDKPATVDKHLNIPEPDYADIREAMRLSRESIFNRFALAALREYAARIKKKLGEAVR